MWNETEVPLLLPTSAPSDRLLQPLWDYVRFNHFALVSSPFFPVLLAFSGYFSFSIPFTLMDLLGEEVPFFHRYKIQKERRPTVQMMMRSFGRAMYNHVVFVIPAVLLNNYFMPMPPLPALAPTVLELLSGFLGAMLLFDTQYFIWHMVHHKNRQLYKWVHAIHHDYVAPFSWSTQHLSPIELMTVGFWSNLDPIMLQCHPLTTWFTTVVSIWMSVEDHIGYDLPWALNHLVPFGLYGGAPAHDIHHQKPNSNFAPFFSHWDRIFGTGTNIDRATQKYLQLKEE
ncbi:Cholesterol 25-hydroxylase-like protein 1, member 1-like [Scleropages formosus]|uniref:Cholesterol 25-hydroxylase-like protein 1, member 1-like n=1 Tax=Scleropages formosus TaxID=113540 RepID=A0A0P7TTX2_SCLFO|nr:cholesterol 25-hydroxylase-like protein 1, member 1 [Scleropages formosus]KPP61074.1 Cholesterol 25-hydroxylase-like protein 1, member 1-like [Scleropages formosus]